MLPEKLKATTDAQGKFLVTTEKEIKEFTWVVNAAGYKKLEQEATSDDGPFTLYLEKDSYQIYETTIYGKEEKRNYSSKTLRREEFLKAPGAAGDPLRAIQNLPGVNRPNHFLISSHHSRLWPTRHKIFIKRSQCTACFPLWGIIFDFNP